jgi:hypothetical protein
MSFETLDRTVTIGNVFVDLHDRALTVAETAKNTLILGVGSSALYGRHRTPINLPGLDMAINIYKGHYAHDRHFTTERVDLSATLSSGNYSLLSVVTMYRGHEHRRRGIEPMPRTVAAFGEYELAQQDFQGHIRATFPDPLKRSSNDYSRGYLLKIPPAKLDTLTEDERQTLETVTQSIQAGLSAANLLITGGSAEDVVTLLGSPSRSLPKDESH